MKKKRLLIINIFFIILTLNAFGQELSGDSVYLEEVVVTGSKIEIARKNMPLAVSVINKSDIEQSDESAILPVLSGQVPGVFITERGITGFGVSDGAAGQINIRGLGGNPTVQVLVLIDGHPQFMGLMGHPLADAYVASDVEKVEIIRGPASVLYGSNAYGGVINIITKKQVKDGISINGKVLYGSFNTKKLAFNSGFRKKGFNIFASVNHDQTDGHRDSSDFFLTNSYIKTGYDFNNFLHITADFSLARFESADPGQELSFSGDTINITRGKAAVTFENNHSKYEGAVKLYYNFGEHKITDGWRSNDEMFGLMAYQSFKPFSGSVITLGYDYIEFGGKGSTIVSVLRDEEGNIIPGPTGPQFVLSQFNNRWVSLTNNALYANFRQVFLNKLYINAGLRYELNNEYGNTFIPQGGLAFDMSPVTTFKSSVSKGFRPPSIRELYLFPPANDKLIPEEMINYDVGWIQKWYEGKIKTELTLFLCKGKNSIISEPFAGPPPPIYRNTGEFRNSGIEFSGRYVPVSSLNFHVTYTYIHMDEPLPASPEHNIFFSGNYKWKKMTLNMQLQQIINLYGSDGKNISIIEKDYSLLSAKIKFQILPVINMFVSGNNLLNQNYSINYGYPMPKVNFMAGINFIFDKEI